VSSEPSENQPTETLTDEERARRAALEKLSDAQLAELYQAMPGRGRNNSALAFNLFPVIIALVGFLLDQYIKFLAVTTFTLTGQVNHPPIPIIGDVFTFTYSQNTGGAFSMFTGVPWLFAAFRTVIILGLLFIIFRRPQWVAASFWIGLSIGMVLGGALGNLIDLLRQGYVVDMLRFWAGDFHWPTFNIADSLVVVGFIILGIYGLFSDWFVAKKPAAAPAETQEETKLCRFPATTTPRSAGCVTPSSG
jgi:signal peptidase II